MVLTGLAGPRSSRADCWMKSQDTKCPQRKHRGSGDKHRLEAKTTDFSCFPIHSFNKYNLRPHYVPGIAVALEIQCQTRQSPGPQRSWTVMDSRCLLSTSYRVIRNVPRPWEVGVGEGIFKWGQRGQEEIALSRDSQEIS